jgi:outer membrane receptor protein involved in Fe transport
MKIPHLTPPARPSRPLILALLASSSAVSGQSVAPVKSVATGTDASTETIVLTPFEVVSDTDNGLLSTNSVSATKGNTPIKEIPQSVYVLNQEFLQAQVPFDLNDMLRYAPGVAVDGDYRNETYQMRGFDGGLPLQNGISISRTFPAEQGAYQNIPEFLPSYTIWGAGGSYPISLQWSLTTRMDNIRDTRHYVSGSTVRALVGPPRTVSFSVQYTK